MDDTRIRTCEAQVMSHLLAVHVTLNELIQHLQAEPVHAGAYEELRRIVATALYAHRNLLTSRYPNTLPSNDN